MRPKLYIVLLSIGAFLSALIYSEIADAQDYAPLLLGMPAEFVISFSLSCILALIIALEALRLIKRANKDTEQ